MAIEIERKFLVIADQLPPLPEGVNIVQGYIPTTNGTSVRIRIAGEEAFMTFKRRISGINRREHEFSIPLADAQEMLNEMCLPQTVEKVRYLIPFAGLVWELDVFSGANAGLTVAELELDHEAQQLELPHWVGTEVTQDERYSNTSLALRPYSTW